MPSSQQSPDSQRENDGNNLSCLSDYSFLITRELRPIMQVRVGGIQSSSPPLCIKCVQLLQGGMACKVIKSATKSLLSKAGAERMGECLTNTLASVTLNMNQIAAFAASQWKELFNTSRCTFSLFVSVLLDFRPQNHGNILSKN